MSTDNQAYAGSMDRSTGASEYDAMEFIVRQVLNRSATATLVLVKAVTPGDTSGPGSVDVQPMVAQLDGYGNAVPHGTVFNLPVMRYQGGGNAVLIEPKVGDIGLAVFASHDISSVKQTKAPGNPGSRRRYDWADGLYIGGFLNGAVSQFVRIGDDGVTITSASGLPVTINAPGGLVVNADATINGNITATGKITTGAGSTFNGKAFDSHKHTGVTTGSGTSGPPA